MKAFLFAPVFLMALSASAQYYYKGILGTKETSDLIKKYQVNKVSRVMLTSYDAENTKSDDFSVQQEFSPASNMLRTSTRSSATNESTLTSYIDGTGNVIKTVDSNNTVVSTTNYTYGAGGQLIHVLSTTGDTDLNSQLTEEHIWQYNNGAPVRMLRIKNRLDTTYVDFKTDEHGNVVEEDEVHKGAKQEPIYYYYDANNRLTDIVRYNGRAKRLLPEYMFEYSPSNQVIQKITVPANNSEYLIWRFQYDGRGLITKEAIYNKQKQLTGKIEYEYSFGS